MILKLAWRNILKNRKRSLITVLSIFIAVFLALFIRSMQLGMYSSVIDNVAGKFTGYIQVHANGFWENRSLDNAINYSNETKNTILKTKGVQGIIPRIETYSLASTGQMSKGVLINGVEAELEKQLSPISKRLMEGSVFGKQESAVILGKGLAKYFKIKTGDTLFLIGQGYHGMSAAGRFLVKGIIDLKNEDLNRSLVMMPLGVLQNYLSAPTLVTNLIVVKQENTNEDKVASRLTQNLNPKVYEVMTWKEMLPELHQAILADNVGGLYMVFILYMIISFGIFSTVLMMTQERIFEFGILTAIGMKKSLIIKALWIETSILSLVGLLSAMIPAIPMMYYFHYNPMPLPSEKADVMEKFGFLPQIAFSIDTDILFYHSALIFSISLFIALYPTVKIWRLNTLKAMHKK